MKYKIYWDTEASVNVPNKGLHEVVGVDPVMILSFLS
jgi:hypothetical protein